MTIKLPGKGGSLEIEIDGDEDTISHFVAKILDETDDGFITGSFNAGDDAVTYPGNTDIRCSFSREGVGYSFPSVVLASEEKPAPFHYLLKPLEKGITAKQQRAYVRVNCSISVKIVEHDDQNEETYTGNITNISGGGCLISAMVPLREDSLVRLRFTIPDGGIEITGALGKIVKARPGEDGARNYVIQFEGMDDHHRDAIVRYTFDVQRKLRRKGEA